MYLLTALTVLELAVFIVAAIVFLIALKFFIDSRKKLQEYLPADERPVFAAEPTPKKVSLPKISRSASGTASKEKAPSGELQQMREMLLMQQRELTRALAQINSVQSSSLVIQDEALEKKVSELQHVIDKKDGEIKSLRQQTELAKEMQSHFNQLQEEVEFLQNKLSSLEQQAWEAKELSIKMESMEQTQHHLERELLRKEEKITELSSENQKLNTLLNTTEDKLHEANMQRQQLQKKLQFMEEMNNDMKQVSDTNRKLQTEIRRIAELESMLNLIMEERDELLRQRIS